MQKRLISMVLALSMALTAMPLPALAQSAPCLLYTSDAADD